MIRLAGRPFFLRQARATDETSIRQLVRSNRLNPLGLQWSRFWVAVIPETATISDDTIIGCGQIKSHRDGSRELASLAVARAWRRQGVATALIHHLLVSEANAIWLTCAGRLIPFYQRYGFTAVTNTTNMPAYFRRVWRLFQIFGRLLPVADTLAVMVRYPPHNF